MPDIAFVSVSVVGDVMVTTNERLVATAMVFVPTMVTPVPPVNVMTPEAVLLFTMVRVYVRLNRFGTPVGGYGGRITARRDVNVTRTGDGGRLEYRGRRLRDGSQLRL